MGLAVNLPVKKSDRKSPGKKILSTSRSSSEIYGQINIPVENRTPSNLGPLTIILELISLIKFIDENSRCALCVIKFSAIRHGMKFMLKLSRRIRIIFGRHSGIFLRRGRNLNLSVLHPAHFFLLAQLVKDLSSLCDTLSSVRLSVNNILFLYLLCNQGSKLTLVRWPMASGFPVGPVKSVLHWPGWPVKF